MAEWHKILREKPVLICLIIGVPLAFVLLFGKVYEYNVVNNVALTICDKSQTSISRSFTKLYEDSERFAVVSYVNDEELVQDELANNHAKAALTIPSDFAEDVKQGRSSNVLLIVNSANNMFANAALSTSQEIARSYTVSMAQKMLESAGLLPEQALNTAYPVRMGVRILGNPTNGYTPFMLGGLMLNGLQIGLMICVVTLLAEEIEIRRFADISTWVQIFCRPLPYLISSVLSYLVSLCAVVNIYDVRMQGSYLDALLLGLAYCFFVINAMLCFSAIAPKKEIAVQLPLLYIMPGLLYSGLSWPAFAMNEGNRLFASLMPIAYAGDTLRDILLLGYAPDLLHHCLIMFAAGVICWLLAGLIFAKRYNVMESGENI